MFTEAGESVNPRACTRLRELARKAAVLDSRRGGRGDAVRAAARLAAHRLAANRLGCPEADGSNRCQSEREKSGGHENDADASHRKQRTSPEKRADEGNILEHVLEPEHAPE